MSRPEVSLENARALYEFYGQHRQNPVFARFVAHPLLSQVYKPHITLEDGVEDAIADELREGRRLVVSPNHLTADDQYVIVAVAQKVKSLRPLRGRTFIPTEPSLSSRNGLAGKALRWAVDELGSIPIVRTIDLERRGIEITDEIKEQHRDAMLRADDIEVAKLIDGEHMAAFWEGTRNRADHTQVQALKKGVAHTALRASAKIGVSVLPIGMYYGGEPTDYHKGDVPRKRAPTLHVGLPFAVENVQTVDELVAQVHPAIQECVDVAVAATRY